MRALIFLLLLSWQVAGAALIQVGPARAITHPNDAIAAASSGDTVEIDAGTYTDVEGTWTQDNLTIRGVGGLAHMVAASPLTNGKGIWISQGSNLTLEYIEFSGAAVQDQNGAGLRIESSGLTISHCYFHDNENGILADSGAGSVVIEYSEFSFNGFGDGQSHNIYMGASTTLTVRYSYFHHVDEGHLLKSRASTNYILYNRFSDETGVSSNSSYQIDLPNGGLSYVIGNLIEKGPNSSNSGAMISYGSEGLTNPSTQLYVVNNTFVNNLGANLVAYIFVQGGAAAALVQNNLFVGNDTLVTGSSSQVTNVQTQAPNFVDEENYDYRPTASTPGIDGGTAPGSGDGFDLTPANQYVHSAATEARPTVGTIDVGAYEFGAPTYLPFRTVEAANEVIFSIAEGY